MLKRHYTRDISGKNRRVSWMETKSWVGLGLVDGLRTAENRVQWRKEIYNVANARIEEGYKQDKARHY